MNKFLLIHILGSVTAADTWATTYKAPDQHQRELSNRSPIRPRTEARSFKEVGKYVRNAWAGQVWLQFPTREPLEILEMFADKAREHPATRLVFEKNLDKYTSTHQRYVDMNNIARDEHKKAVVTGLASSVGYALLRNKRALNYIVLGFAFLTMYVLGLAGSGSGGSNDGLLRLGNDVLSTEVTELQKLMAYKDKEMGELRDMFKNISGLLNAHIREDDLYKSLENSEKGISKLEKIYQAARHHSVLDMSALEGFDLEKTCDRLEEDVRERGGPDYRVVSRSRHDWILLKPEQVFGDGYFSLKVNVPMTSPRHEMRVLKYNGSPVQADSRRMLTVPSVSNSYLLLGPSHFGIMTEREFVDCHRFGDEYLICPSYKRVAQKIESVSDNPGPSDAQCLLAIFNGWLDLSSTWCITEEEELKDNEHRFFVTGDGLYQVLKGGDERIDLYLTCVGFPNPLNFTMVSGESLQLPHGCSANFGKKGEIEIGRSGAPSSVIRHNQLDLGSANELSRFHERQKDDGQLKMLETFTKYRPDPDSVNQTKRVTVEGPKNIKEMNQDIKEKWVEENPGPKEVMNWLMRNAWWMIVVGFFVLMGVCICFGLGKSGLDPFGPCKKKERNQPEISMNDVAAF